MRRTHLLVASVAVVLLLPAVASAAQPNPPQTPLAGSAIPQFVQQLPVLDAAGGTIKTADGTGSLTIRMCEFWANVLPPGTPLAAGASGKTRVWGYIEGASCPANGPSDPAVDTYIGPVILATRDVPTPITWINDLGTTDTTQVLAYKYSTDQTLHWADPLNAEENMCNHLGTVPAVGSDCAKNYGEGITGGAPIPAAVHLHGGEVPPELDGGPDSWFTSDGAYKGHGYYSSSGAPANGAIYNYPNRQEAAPIWFHDHTLGATRLNVYAGLAGGYLIQDPALTLPAGLAAYGLQRGAQVDLTVPLVIQDRMFDTNGQLFFPADSAANVLWTPNAEHPYWVPEFVGDTIVVNGKASPYFNVEPKRYRFLLVNGSNARTYDMFLTNQATGAAGPAMYVIGTDGGYLDAPVKIDPALGQKLLMQPGERYEVIVDFAGYAAGTNFIIRNTGRTPFSKGPPPQGSVLGRIMQFRVGPCTSGFCGAADTSYKPATGAALRTGLQQIKRLVNPATGTLAAGVTAAKTRQLTLNEVMGMPATVTDPVTGVTAAYPGGPLEILVNNTKWGGGVDQGTNSCLRSDFRQVTIGGVTTCYSETPTEGDTEVWEIVNLTADAHPIHLHLVQFQLLNRQNFNVSKYNKAYAAAFPTALYQPGYGPPLSYGPSTASGNKYGGNPDIAPWLQGLVKPPLPQEAGWKDTVVTYPGQVTRIAVRWAPMDLPTTTAVASLHFTFDPSGANGHGYVWHCHIIDHEDNEMMRPDTVDLNPAAPAPASRDLVIGVDY